MSDKFLSRQLTQMSYQMAIITNKSRFSKGDPRVSEEYTYPNQQQDADKIINMLTVENKQAVSVIKKPKVGADGLMIEIAVKMATHSNDDIIIPPENCIIITGMSNKEWEINLKHNAPSVFKENIFHRGKINLLRGKLLHIKNAVIMIDEIDVADKENQMIHELLENSGLLDINYLLNNNVKFVLISATNKFQLGHLDRWGEYHCFLRMTIPSNYISSTEFLQMGCFQEYYDIIDEESAECWVLNDILLHFGTDYRINIIRAKDESIGFIKKSCDNHEKSVLFYNHNSQERIPAIDLREIFERNLTSHIVIAVKGFYRRADLIPNAWKLKLGSLMDYKSILLNTNVAIQSLAVGRIHGYWKAEAMNPSHKLGIFRTSLQAVQEYEEFQSNPLGQTEFSMPKRTTYLNPTNIENLEVVLTPDETEKKRFQDELKKRKRIPLVMKIPTEFQSILYNPSSTSSEKRNVMREIVKGYNLTNLLAFINLPETTCCDFTRPKTDCSYKKTIEDVVSLFNKKANCKWRIHATEPSNSYCVAVDTRQHRLIITTWVIKPNDYSQEDNLNEIEYLHSLGSVSTATATLPLSQSQIKSNPDADIIRLLSDKFTTENVSITDNLTVNFMLEYCNSQLTKKMTFKTMAKVMLSHFNLDKTNKEHYRIKRVNGKQQPCWIGIKLK